MISGKKIFALIPAYNEEKTIAKILVKTERIADAVVVVDDGSTDETAQIAERLNATVLRHEKNLGKGAALRTGVDYLKKEKSFDILVTLDADDQHDPSEIQSIVAPIIEGSADVVVGVRPMDSRVMPRQRIVGNKLFDRMTNSPVRDTQSGFRAYTLDALGKISFSESGMAVESQTLMDAVRAGLRIKEVPISTTYQGIVPKRSAANHFAEVLEYIITRTVADHPLQYLGLPGIISILIGVAAGLRVVDIFVKNQQIAAGTALIAVTLIIIGAVMIATSMIIKLLTIQATR